MSETYAKLFSSILRSSIWTEPLETKIVWITMLAMSDRHGYVGASIPGIASAAGVPVDKAAEAIAKFLAPDEWSRSKDFDGRRIEEADRGWNILNYERFRDMRDEEARKEYERNRKREARQRKNVPDSLGTNRDTQGQTGTVPQCPTVSAHAEASASASPSAEEKEKPAARKRAASVLVEKPEDVSQDVWDSWLVVRKSKNAKLTTVAMAAVKREADKAGWTLEAAIRECAERNWQTFRASWLSDKVQAFQSRPAPGYVASNSHIQNTPLGSLMCQCTECVKYREKHGIRGIGDEA